MRRYMGDCQNYGPLLGPYYNTGPNTGPNLGDPKRDHNFDNPPYMYIQKQSRYFGNLPQVLVWGHSESQNWVPIGLAWMMEGCGS